jgi:type I restriction enzyme, S subunit
MTLTSVQTQWPMVRLKHLVQVNPETLGEDTDEGFEFQYIDIGSVRNGRITQTEVMRFGTAPSRARRVVRAGDVLVSTVRTYLRAVAGVPADHAGHVASTGFAVLRPDSEALDPRFLRYWCLSEPFISEVVARSVGVSYPAINASEVAALQTALPPLAAQRRIADYLDLKVHQLDTALAKVSSMQDLLRAREAAWADHALASGAPTTIALKWLLDRSPEYGLSEAAVHDDPAWPRYIRITDITADGSLKDDTFRSLPPEVARGALLEEGDILLARSGATVGKAFCYRSDIGPSCFAGYLIRVRPDLARVTSEWLMMFFSSATYWNQIAETLVQATIPNVSAERYSVLRVPVPSLQQQQQLSAEYKLAVARSRRVEARIRQLAALLTERRSALITAAVAGQLDLDEVA